MKGIIIISLIILLSSMGIHSSSANENLQESEIKAQLINEQIARLVRERKREQYYLKLKQARKQRIIDLYRQRKSLEDSLVFNSAENIEYKSDMDIFSKMKYNRIQERALSCELSATSDILSHLEYRKISETSIINMVDKSHYNQVPTIENGKTIWGNPNAGYVGNIHELSPGINATQSGMTGYGVLEKPIAKIYDKFNYKNKIITSESYNESYNEDNHLTELLKELNVGNMVQLWGDYCTNPEFEDTDNINSCSRFGKNRKLQWYYKENGELKSYTGLAGEHAFYLLGYKGGVIKPSHIIVWDTKTGKHTYPIGEWMRKWNAMDNKSIVIYKKYN